MSEAAIDPKSSISDVELLKQATEAFAQFRAAMGQVIVGQDAMIQSLFISILTEGHVRFVGVPGLGKTLIVKRLAEVLGWSFQRIQFTPDMMPSDIIGMQLLEEDATTQKRVWRFHRGPIFSNLILADEINRTPPKTQSALLEAMQEYTVTSMGQSHALERPFLVIATQNPIEQEGTYPLPEAQLDRFTMSLTMDYPTASEESAIVAQTTVEVHQPKASAQTLITPLKLRAFQQLVRRMPIGRHVIDYAVALVRATRPLDAAAEQAIAQYLTWGAGPRGGQSLILCAKALALLSGQPAVCCEHVRQVAAPVLQHRLLLNYRAQSEGLTATDLVHQLTALVSEPSYTDES